MKLNSIVGTSLIMALGAYNNQPLGGFTLKWRSNELADFLFDFTSQCQAELSCASNCRFEKNRKSRKSLMLTTEVNFESNF